MADTKPTVSFTDNYQVATTHGGWRFVPESGLLKLAGPDRLDFLQRQTTNDLRRLAEDQPITTVLTSPTARILDVLRVYTWLDELIAITLPTYAQQTFAFLKSRIFFKDNVTITDLSARYGYIELLGPSFPLILTQLDPGFDPERGFQSVAIQDSQGLYIPIDEDLTIGAALLLPEASLPAWKEWATGKSLPVIARETAEILRVEAGLPGSTTELTDQYTPLEVRLASAISSTKGCYTGQEVIARQITYDKIIRQLYPLQLQAQADIGSPLEAGGQPAGILTSCVHSPRFGWIGLAVIKTKSLESGETLRLAAFPEQQLTLLSEPLIRR